MIIAVVEMGKRTVLDAVSLIILILAIGTLLMKGIALILVDSGKSYIHFKFKIVIKKIISY